MLKGNCRKKNLTTCERKISSYKPAFRKPVILNIESAKLCATRALMPYVSHALRALVPHVPHVLRALVGYIPRVVGTQLNTDTKFGLYAKALLSRTVVPEAYLESSQTSTIVQCCKSS